ncbi:MAG: response regulator transcription factor [Bacteroidales bacterium]|nr:response regulator transcription factor [Bacteroidales bacterium]
MNCIAIDDEPLALNVIEDLCKKISFVNLVAKCISAIEAVKILNQNKIDLIFLDIQMPNITGLDFVKTLDQPPMIIFTTAYSSHALEGFELNAIDYLVKPISFERFFKAISKAYEIYNLKKNKNISQDLSETTDPVNFLMVKSEYKTVKVNLNEILYIEGLKDYLKIYIGQKPLLTKSTLKNIEEKLPPDKFIRVHKSYIVSIAHINSIANNRIIIGEKLIPVGNQYKLNFYTVIDKLKL